MTAAFDQWETDPDFTGYRIDIESRAELEAYASPFLLQSSDFQAPEQIDPRGKVRHDKQGNMGSCQGFSLANACEYLWLLHRGANQHDDEHQFSSLFCYLESQRFDGLLGRDSGSTISGGLKVSMQVGVLPESQLKYRTPYPSNARSMITDAMRAEASKYKVRSYAWLKSYSDIFNYLASGAGAVHTGTVWNNSFYATNGVLEDVSLRNGGGHATAWLGYSKRKDSRGRNYIWRLNSHNDSWTELSPSVVDKICGHNYTAIVGMSDMETPVPRPVPVDFTKESILG
jgi:hypothetical protein